MEIGTGWQPMIPILLSLAGAQCVYLTDLNRLCRADTFDATLHSLRSQKRAILNQLPISEEEFDRAVRPGRGDMDRRFRDLRLVYLAPCDCRRLKLAAESIDIVTSRAVLEHIPPQIIRDIFLEAGRVLKRDGVMCHFVDNSDHWEHNDKSISPVNFLKFSDAVFRWTTVNGLNYQNRLRHSQYIDMLRETGFQVVRETGDVDAGALAALRTLAIAPRFRAFTAEDLATTKSYLLASRVPVAPLSAPVHTQSGVQVV